MTIGMSTALRDARLDAITTAAGSGALIDIYNGTRPATGGTATTLLGTVTCGSVLGAPSSGGVLTFGTITSGTAVASSTATWARLTTSGGTFLFDMSVGTSSADLNLNSVVISSGATISVTSGTLTDGNA